MCRPGPVYQIDVGHPCPDDPLSLESSVLIPQFTIRRLLWMTTVCGAFCLIVSLAARGNAWALALSAAGLGLVVCFLFFSFLFASAWCAFFLTQQFGSNRRPDSPFAQHRPPPQVIPSEGQV